MKIAYIYSTMAMTGGTERMITEKANYLAEQLGYEVTIITCFQLAHEQNFFPLSPKVRQINLCVPFYSQYKFKYPKRLWIKWQMNLLLKKGIRRAVKETDPDILIGVSRFRANYVSSLRCRAKKIIECHESRYNTAYDATLKRPFFSRVFMKFYDNFYFRTMERKADAIVTLTEGDRQLWKHAKRTEAIPNFSTTPVSRYSDCTEKHVIAVGRLAWEKGFGRLIKAWAIVSAKHPDWQLDIFGKGLMHDELVDMTRQYHALHVVFHGCSDHISQEYAASSICAVTSYFEGFSLVILEAMRHGLPCVAYDCPFGPANIIEDGRCGYLVEDDNTELFAERLCRLIEQEDVRKQFSKAAIERANAFDVDIIMNRCKQFYEQLLQS